MKKNKFSKTTRKVLLSKPLVLLLSLSSSVVLTTVFILELSKHSWLGISLFNSASDLLQSELSPNEDQKFFGHRELAGKPKSSLPNTTKKTQPYCGEKRDLTLPRKELRGVWLSNVGESSPLYTKGMLEDAMKSIKNSNLNTVYPIVWNKGFTFFTKGTFQAEFDEKFGQTNYYSDFWPYHQRDTLQEVIDVAKKYDIRVIPWFEYGIKIHADNKLFQTRPELFSTGIDPNDPTREIKIWQAGKYKFAYLNPFHPESQKVIRDLVVNVVTNYDVDGIQFDDHFALPVNFGYDDYTVQLYASENNGRKPPLKVNDPEWVKWRAKKFTEFYRYLVKEVRAVKPDAYFTLSPHNWNYAYHSFLQDWKTWVQDGLLHEVIIQLYRRTTDSFSKELKMPEVVSTAECYPVSIALFVEPLDEFYGLSVGESDSIYPTQEQQIKMIREAGLDGVSFFDYEKWKNWKDYPETVFKPQN